MRDLPADARWLLVDAAGPAAAAGIVAGGAWVAQRRHDGDFLEWLEPAVAGLLDECGLKLADLAGALYATGPGSTLGLRLAAMFLRTLLELPQLRHWRCLRYHNMEVALAAGGAREAVAPWRRDRLHHAAIVADQPLQFRHGGLAPDEAAAGAHGILLGRRPANAADRVDWHPYPIGQVPELLAAHPELLSETRNPAPYAAEDPAFARWNAGRHVAR